MHQGKLSATFLFSFAKGTCSALQIFAIAPTLGGMQQHPPALVHPCAVPCTAAPGHASSSITCKPSKPSACTDSLLRSAPPSASCALRGAKQMVWLLTSWVSLTQVGCCALAVPALQYKGFMGRTLALSCLMAHKAAKVFLVLEEPQLFTLKNI